ncbi:MAG: Gfo/Idh/MocA family oxidoreductase [Armatimonadetes bacterium]|nr:Gfo/Idh/MocA family oxidoreductase [Armatimonadota bacterium]MDE2206297.1 Gfo/Idh/MocA family oxidoreductase [Armatimonadota bacterium]
MKPYRAILVGTGGWGGSWCHDFLPPNVADGLVEVVAAADRDPAALENARTALHLPDERLFSSAKAAMDAHEADFCIVVTQPVTHEEVVDEALAHGLHILCEKPIADTLEASTRIAAKVKRAGVKMAVTMSHRFDRDKTTLRRVIREPASGPLDYLVCRFTCDCRRYGSWGRFRQEMDDPLMIEGAVHHLDILADMAGGLCDTIYAQTWRPDWAEYQGDCQGLVTMHMTNGVRAHYEGAKSNAVGLNGWTTEYIRAECRNATLILDRRELVRYAYDAGREWSTAAPERAERIDMIDQAKWANAWLVEQFVEWLDGGPPMETNVEANLQSVALVFGAIQSARTGRAVAVQEMLGSAVERAQEV